MGSPESKPAHPPSPSKKVRSRGPESAFFDTLKMQQCNLWLHGEEKPERVFLLWVDVYTIGIRVQTGREQLIYKKFIRRIERDEHGVTEKTRTDLAVVG